MRRLRILHISDLHERAAFDGMPPSRAKTIAWDARQRGVLLGDRFTDALTAIARDRIDLVCLTGDLADWGMSSEYAKATERLERILRLVSVPRARFFAVPGNHDVQRSLSVEAWTEMRSWLARTNDLSALGRWVMGPKGPPYGTKPEWIPDVLRRTAGFWSWLNDFRGDDLRATASETLGYRSTIPAGTIEGISQPVHVVGLDSAWLCGGEATYEGGVLKDQGGIAVTQEQVDAHIRAGEHPLDGYRIALIHHPLEHLVDHTAIRRLLGDNGADILLHGHQHEPSSTQSLESGSALQVLAAGCLVEGDLGRDWPNGFQVIEIDPGTRAGCVFFHKWSANGRFWAKGSDIYRDAPDGVLKFGVEAPSVPPQPIKSEAVDAQPVAARAVEVVHLAFASHGYSAEGPIDVPVCGSLCLTSDAPDQLRKAILQMRSSLSVDPLVPPATREMVAKASLRELFQIPIVRVSALRQLSTTWFSAYFYYCRQSAFEAMTGETRTQSLMVRPLFHRLSKKKQRIESVGSRIPGVQKLLETARDEVVEEYRREPALPVLAAPRLAVLEELASFVVAAVCEYLANPQDPSAAEIFESLRTRIRFAENVATGELHLRDVNPLP